ncbi:MAG TPA: SCO family protein [Verrucomicrobiae bacterium]|nr:SCO family protein [Verrucomicrobiae bacterium]
MTGKSMRPCVLTTTFLFVSLMVIPAQSTKSPSGSFAPREFSARGVITAINSQAETIVIQNETISNFMAAMTMPFKVKSRNELLNFQRGDQISFQLHVLENGSWIDQIQKVGFISLPAPANSVSKTYNSKSALLAFPFTNELGQTVRLNDFHGQALAITFFYTRCPLPDYCPRLSKNFQEASEKMEAMNKAPTNWHFLSITFDPQTDSPETLRAYGQSYHYDPAHWSFLTGPPEEIAELAQRSGVTYENDGVTINHNFRTLIIDPSGHLQMIFPTSGDLSGQIVAEILKAAAPATSNANLPKSATD